LCCKAPVANASTPPSPPFFLLLYQTCTSHQSGQGRSDSPVYANLQELKLSQDLLPPPPAGSPLQAQGDWETYQDHSGRHYYYNPATQERTWKPPRARDSTAVSHADGLDTEVRVGELLSPAGLP